MLAWTRHPLTAAIRSDPVCAFPLCSPHPAMMPARTIRTFLLVASGALPAAAQAPVHGDMLPGRGVSVGVVYAHDSWDEYWEGTLKRRNGNIGTITTQSTTF